LIIHRRREVIMRLLVAGASGFIGSRLCPALHKEGHTALAMTRAPQRYRGAGEAVFGDVADPDSLRAAMADCDVAYYLVHSLGRDDFEEADARAARNFGRAASAAGVRRIVSLGGLGDEREELSPHLRSRRQVEELLAEADVR
jgi:uncharacterized protein YbjT (DUF2867 family)